MRVYVDPKTGRIIPRPDGTPSDIPQAAPLRQTADGLQEEPVTVPAGGYRVDLKGRFRSTMKLTMDPTGHRASECGILPVTGTVAK